VRVERAAVERLRPRAVVASLDRLDVAPAGAALYAGAGQRDAERCAGRLPAGLAAARALLVNRVEARLLTGEADPSDAALALAETVRTAVVTCGAEGAVAAAGGALTTAAAPAVHAIDTTGAGDVFVAAYVWGDLEGLPLEERLRRAAVVAALSVRTSTGAGGAPTREELEHFLADEQSAMVNE
jgi:sugar/nucleoside kinase (ribokinase family)